MTSDRLIAGRYRLSDPIGTGAMGVVWKATDVRLQRTVAVKQLRLDPGLTPSQAVEARARAMREGRIAARLHHPNAITVFDVAEEDGRPWLVMEFMDAPSLAARISGGRTLPPMEVARIGAQAAAALAAAHKAGILHRDVKPGNLLVGDDGTVKITDFGISRAIGDVTVTATGFLAGTPAYLAPEVARGEDGEPASDVFALGSTLYAAVTGSPPFGEGDNPLAVLHAVARGQVQPPQHAGALGPVLMQLLAPTPEARPTMRQAAEVLEGVAVGRPAGPASVLPPGGYPRTAVLAGPGGTTVLPDPNRFGGPPPNDPRSVPPGPRVNAFRPAYGPGSGAPGAYGPATPGYGPGGSGHGPGTPGYEPGGSGHAPGTPGFGPEGSGHTPGFGPGTPGSAPGFEPGAPGSGPAQGPPSGPAPDGGQREGGANSVPAAGSGSSSAPGASGASGSGEVASAQAKGSGERVELSKRDGAVAGAAVGAASASKLGDAGSAGGKAADAAAPGSEASESGADGSAASAGSAVSGPAAGNTSADAGTADAGSADADAASFGGPGATPAPATTANLGTAASSDSAPSLGTTASSDSVPGLGAAASSDSAPSGPASSGPAFAGSAPSDTPAPDPTTALPYTPDYAAFAAAARPAPATPLEYTPPRRDPAAGKRLQLTALGAIAVAVIVLAGVLIALIANGTGDEQQAAPPPPPSTSAPAPTTEAPTTTQPPPTSNAPAPQNGPPTPEQQAQFVQGYYGMLPGDINGAWAQLSPGYQAQTGGFGAYSQFWSTIRGVRVGAVTPSGPDTVVANLTYTLAGGGTSSESRWFRVSTEGGRFVISGSGL